MGNLQVIETTDINEERVGELQVQLDVYNSQSILNFGVDAQKQLTSVTDQMLTDVKSKDSGEAGKLLSEMVVTLKGFRGQETNLAEDPSFFQRLFKKLKPFSVFVEQFDGVSNQIDKISNGLEARKQDLLIDISTLDNLYDATLNYFQDLRHHIIVAESKLKEADDIIIPSLREKAQNDGSMESAQNLRDFQTHRDELERRLHDLRLTKQVAMQALPSIRMIQENDKGLVNKINTTLVNTVPLWRQQLAQSIAIFRSGEAAQALKDSSDLTNALLINNAENLQMANRETRNQIERGIFDVESVTKANDLLIATIEESITIQKEASLKRKEAEIQLNEAETKLKNALLSASKSE